jgi:hypothetical protein
MYAFGVTTTPAVIHHSLPSPIALDTQDAILELMELWLMTWDHLAPDMMSNRQLVEQVSLRYKGGLNGWLYETVA